MKVVILAGGLGTRMAEETALRPKPMVEVGGKPILDHIMRWYAKFGHKEFIIALGYRGDLIKQYFLNYYAVNSDITVTLKNGDVTMTQPESPIDDWTVHLVDTGAHTHTAGRIARLRQHLVTETQFLMTYGDGVSDVNLDDLVAFHQKHGKPVTLTAIHPPSRFGGLSITNGVVTDFTEKPERGEGLINGGYFVVNRSVLDLLTPDSPMWERHPLPQLSRQGDLMAYHHPGFWQAMDNIRERQYLEELWQSGNAPWMVK